MRIDIEFYMDGTLEERLSQITAPESPIKIKKKEWDCYFLDPKEDSVLNSFFVYAAPDSEEVEAPLHIEAQKALTFKAKSNLHYGECLINREKVEAFEKIMEYISSQGIPAYMTAVSEQ